MWGPRTLNADDDDENIKNLYNIKTNYRYHSDSLERAPSV